VGAPKQDAGRTLRTRAPGSAEPRCTLTLESRAQALARWLRQEQGQPRRTRPTSTSKMACSNVDSPTPPTRGKGWAAACAREANGRSTATLDGPTGWRRDGYLCIGYCFIKYGICSRTSHATTTRSRRTSSSLAGIVHTWKGAVHRPGVATWQHAATRPRSSRCDHGYALHWVARGSMQSACPSPRRPYSTACYWATRWITITPPEGHRSPAPLAHDPAAGWVTTRAPLKGNSRRLRPDGLRRESGLFRA